MADPLVLLVPVFRAAIGAAFGPEHAGVDPMIRPSQHADYQANVALGLAKALRRPPREVATAIVEKLAGADEIERTEIAGPGFVNIWVKNAFLSRELARAS